MLSSRGVFSSPGSSSRGSTLASDSDWTMSPSSPVITVTPAASGGSENAQPNRRRGDDAQGKKRRALNLSTGALERKGRDQKRKQKEKEHSTRRGRGHQSMVVLPGEKGVVDEDEDEDEDEDLPVVLFGHGDDDDSEKEEEEEEDKEGGEKRRGQGKKQERGGEADQREELFKSRMECSEKEETISAQQMELDLLKLQLQDANFQLDQSRKKLRNKKKLESRLREEIASLENAHQQELAEIQEEVLKEISANEAEKQELSTRLEAQQGLLEEKDHQVKDLEEALKSQSRDNAALRSELNSLRKRLGAGQAEESRVMGQLQQRLKDLEERGQAQRDAISRQKRKRQEAKEEVDRAVQECQELRSQLQGKDGELRRMEADIQMMGRKLDQKRELFESCEQAMREARKKLLQTNDRAERLKEECRGLHHKMQQQEDTFLSRQRQSLEAVERMLALAQQQHSADCDKLREEVTRKDVQLGRLEEKMERMRQCYASQLEQAQQGFEAEQASAGRKMEILRHREAALEEEVRAVREELQRAVDGNSSRTHRLRMRVVKELMGLTSTPTKVSLTMRPGQQGREQEQEQEEEQEHLPEEAST